MSNKDQTVVITARIPKKLDDRINEYCDYVEGLTKSHFVHKCLDMEIDRFNDNAGENPILPDQPVGAPDRLIIPDPGE
jgi:hypothetical protein